MRTFRIGPRSVAVALAVAAALGWHGRDASEARASVAMEASVDDLAAGSALVIVGAPVESHAVWEDGAGARRRRIVTYTRLRVERTIDGASAADVWVRTLGGIVGELGQRVDGEAAPGATSRGLAFLGARPDGTYEVVGRAQGYFPVETANDGTSVVGEPRQVGTVLPTPGATPARSRLVGLPLDEAARVIVAARRAHAR